MHREYMKLSNTIFIALLIISYSIQSYAVDSDNAKAKNTNSHSNLMTNSSAVSQRLLVQDIATASIDNTQPLALPSQLKGEFNTRLLSIEAGVLESKQNSNWNKYYFQGAVTLHQNNDLNVSLMANIEQINNFNHNAKAPFIDSVITINDTEFNYSYGIVTSYSVTPAWQFSGGIIHAAPVNEAIENTWYGDANIALIGTTYSF